MSVVKKVAAPTNEELLAIIADLQKQISAVQKAPAEATVVIGCRLMGGVVLENKDETIVIRVPWREEIEVYESDFRAVLTNPFGYRELFKNDVLYFADEADYARFRITKELSLSEETVLEEIMAPTMMEWVKSVTLDKHRTNVLYCILFMVAQLFKEGKLDKWNYDLRTQFQSYLGVDLKTYVAELGTTNLIG